MLAIGLVLVFVRNHFKQNQDVVLEVGVNLALFGFTTLLVTLIASQQLEHRLVAELQAKMDEHVENVRLVMGANPYPYGAEAHRSFSLIVKRVTRAPNDHQSLHRDIFEQYQHRHFETPWRDGLRVIDRHGAFVPPDATFNPLAPGVEEDGTAEPEGDGG
jgi:hypothetical protein